MDFSGHTIAILGASGGIGSTLAANLVDSGATLMVASRKPEAYESHEWSESADVSTVDVSQPERAEKWIGDVSPDSGLDAVVNCVGTMDLKPLEHTSYEAFDEAINLNLKSSFALLKGYLSALPDEGGSFLGFSSAAAGRGIPNHAAIGAAKAGLEGLVRSVAASYADRGLRANCIAPGLVETPLSDTLLRSDRARERSEDMHPMGRLGQPDDLVEMARVLIHPDNDWITGQVVGVDGGLRSLQSR